MKARKFIEENLPFAQSVEGRTGIPALAILAQAALESGWGDKSIGNNIFGIKYAGKGLFKWVLTTEYSHNKNAFREEDIMSRTYLPKTNKYLFKVYQRFADYPTPEDAFLAHSELLLSSRYRPALNEKDPAMYLKKIWELGYATDPDYPAKIEGVVKSIKRRL